MSAFFILNQRTYAELVGLVIGGKSQRPLFVFDFITASGDVFGKAILRGVITGQSGCKVAAQGNIDGAFDNSVIAFSDIEIDVATLTIELSALGVNGERATNRVSAKQETLRAAQNFCSVNIVQAGNHGAVTAFVQIVFEKRGGRIATHTEILGANTAHGNGINVGVLRVTAHAGGVGD